MAYYALFVSMAWLANRSIVLHLLEYQDHWEMRLDDRHVYKVQRVSSRRL